MTYAFLKMKDLGCLDGHGLSVLVEAPAWGDSFVTWQSSRAMCTALDPLTAAPLNELASQMIHSKGFMRPRAYHPPTPATSRAI